jgi:hypothetical protein
MDFEKAIDKYLTLRKECDEINRNAKVEVGKRKEVMKKLEAWISLKADEAGLKTIPTQLGTGYWSTHHTCTLAEPESFFQYIKSEDAWDLLEKRASKTAVKAFIEEEGAPPPGVNFSSYMVFNVREQRSK